MSYEFLRDWKLKQLDKSKVVTSGEWQTTGRKIRTVDVSFVSVSRPHTNHFISEDTERSNGNFWLTNCHNVWITWGSFYNSKPWHTSLTLQTNLTLSIFGMRHYIINLNGRNNRSQCGLSLSLQRTRRRGDSRIIISEDCKLRNQQGSETPPSWSAIKDYIT